MRNVYHSVGITDLQALKDQAEARLKNGEETVIHPHPFSVPCHESIDDQHLVYGATNGM